MTACSKSNFECSYNQRSVTSTVQKIFPLQAYIKPIVLIYLTRKVRIDKTEDDGNIPDLGRRNAE